MNSEQYTTKTIEAINTAQAMAVENRNAYVTPEHLLYALLDADGGLIGTASLNADDFLQIIQTANQD